MTNDKYVDLHKSSADYNVRIYSNLNSPKENERDT